MKSIKKVKSVLGIDIADHTLSIVELQKNRNHPFVASVARVSIPPGVVVRGRIRDTEKLEELFEYAVKTAQSAPIKARTAIMGIPDSQLYTHLVRLPSVKDSELEESARMEALQTFPIEKRDLVYSYRVISRSGEGADVLFIATSKEVLREWDLFFHKIGFEVPFYDSEVLATARGLAAHGVEEAFCLIDIGAATTTVSVFDKVGIRYVHSIEHAGSALTDEIARHESLPFDEAQKRKHSLDLSDIPTSLATILPSFFDPIIKEIDTAVTYASQAYGMNVKRIILVGGTSALLGLPEYIQEKTGIETERGTPIIDGDPRDHPQRDTPSIESVGLALHGLNTKEYENAPQLQSPPEETPQNNIEAKRGVPQAYDASVEQVKEFHDIRKEQKHIRNQIATLMVVLFVGAALIVAAFWYQRQEQARKEIMLRQTTPQYTYQQTVKMDISVIIGKAEGKVVAGRLYRFQVPEGASINEAILAEAEVNLRRQMNAGEDYWKNPFDPPLTYLVFDKNELRSFVGRSIEERSGSLIPFDLGHLEYLSVHRSDEPTLFILTVNASISAPAQIQGLE